MGAVAEGMGMYLPPGLPTLCSFVAKINSRFHGCSSRSGSAFCKWPGPRRPRRQRSTCCPPPTTRWAAARLPAARSADGHGPRRPRRRRPTCCSPPTTMGCCSPTGRAFCRWPGPRRLDASGRPAARL